ncbi:MAG: exodeoxyribonuclease VII large subunit [Thermogutta sp.]
MDNGYGESFDMWDRSGDLPVFSVSQLTAAIKEVLEGVFPGVTVVGEISDLSVAKSGHCYLTLKDEGAQLPCVIWRSTFSQITFQLHDGLEVFCRGRLNVYPPHGRYQFIIEYMEPSGWGAAELALRQLKERLAKEGLFDASRKRPLPKYPRWIAVITSPTGAAIHDFLTALRSRLSPEKVLIVPARVQGLGASEEIAQSLRLINQLVAPIDVVVLTRGGGSAEDLSAFNTEEVVRAIAGSKIPVVSAVGHDIDVTLADLAADIRALTPTDAASKVAPSRAEVTELINRLIVRLQSSMALRLQMGRAVFQRTAEHPFFRRPKDWLYAKAQLLDELDSQLDRAGGLMIERFSNKLQQKITHLESLSPLAVLSRGYSITFTYPQGQLVVRAAQLRPGDHVRTRFAEGSAISRIEEMSP